MTTKSEQADDRSASARLSRAVKHIRETKQLTLVAVAAATGISRNTLFLIETKEANARLSTIDTLASLMGVDSSQLLEKSPQLSGRLPARASLSHIVANNIAAFRTSIHMSQEALGEAAGLAKGYLSLIEIAAPDLKVNTVEAIARVLGVDVTFLLADVREGRTLTRKRR